MTGDAPAPGQPEQKAVRLLQGYVWHPREEDIDLGDWLPRTLPGSISVLWDPLPRAPFTFFEDGTPSSTQVVYQFTVVVLTFAGDDDDLEGMLPWVAEQLQERLEDTPAGVGWAISEDLRPLEQ
ncbi:MAG TPA: DUF3208 family protein [Deinococcales bacterium]|nr:DUF3208 family protein [Deinococcales bacterium]